MAHDQQTKAESDSSVSWPETFSNWPRAIHIVEPNVCGWRVLEWCYHTYCDVISVHERCSRGPKLSTWGVFQAARPRNEKIELQICFVSIEGGGRLCDQAIVKILYVCAHVYVSLGGLSSVQVVGRPFGWRPSPNIVAWHFYHPSAQINLASRQPWQPPAILSHSRQSGSVGWAKPGRAGRGIRAR